MLYGLLLYSVFGSTSILSFSSQISFHFHFHLCSLLVFLFPNVSSIFSTNSLFSPLLSFTTTITTHLSLIHFFILIISIPTPSPPVYSLLYFYFTLSFSFSHFLVSLSLCLFLSFSLTSAHRQTFSFPLFHLSPLSRLSIILTCSLKYLSFCLPSILFPNLLPSFLSPFLSPY